MKSVTSAPKDLPEIVYKYRDWHIENHRRMITHGELWMASPVSFNDPFDCRISENFLGLDFEGTRKYVEKMTALAILSQPNKDVSLQIGAFEKRLENLEAFQTDDDKRLFANIDRQWGVLSLSAIWDNILMWSHYGNHHKGFCVGFREEKLRESGKLHLGGLVSYRDRFPNISPLDDDSMGKIFVQIMTKAKDWEYEEEYRLFKADWNNTSPNGSWRKVIVSGNCIAEVILGLRIEESHQREILEICGEKQIPVFQAIQVPREFRIDRQRII